MLKEKDDIFLKKKLNLRSYCLKLHWLNKCTLNMW